MSEVASSKTVEPREPAVATQAELLADIKPRSDLPIISIDKLPLARLDIGPLEGSVAHVYKTVIETPEAETAVAVKIWKPWQETYRPAQLVRLGPEGIAAREQAALESELIQAQITDLLGIGPRLYGIVGAEDDRLGYVVDFIDGQTDHDATNITEQTVNDLQNIKVVCERFGLVFKGDFQYMVTEAGRALVIDPTSLRFSSKLEPEVVASAKANLDSKIRAAQVKVTPPD